MLMRALPVTPFGPQHWRRDREHVAMNREADEQARTKKRSTKRERERFPYEPRVVGGKLLMPAELQAIHRYVVETPVLEAVTEEIRAVVQTIWPELISKLPPKP